VITQADFLARPNGDDMAQFYPDRAQRMEKGGKASIHCVVTVKGTLTGCTVVPGSEDPPGWDFGQQSLKLAHLFKVRPATVNGKPVEASITVPIRWELAD
jgi:protein TonB